MSRAVLVVNDDPVTHRLLGRVLSDDGYRVRIASSAEDAFEQLRRRGPGLVITDWDLPGMNGPDFCRTLRDDPLLRHSYIIMLTGRTGRDHLIEGLNAGSDEYLTKPFATRELVARVRVGERLLKQRSEIEAIVKLRQELADLGDAQALVERVLGALGHELRTPLATICAASEYLLTDAAVDQEERRDCLSMLHIQSVRLARLVGDLLDASSFEHGARTWRWESIHLEDVIEDALLDVEPLTTAAGVVVRRKVHPNVTAQGDAAALRRAVANLVASAADRCRDGEIIVEARPDPGGADRWLIIRVRDDGLVCASSVLHELGPSFILGGAGRVGESRPADGLALNICRAVAAVHGGRLAVDAAPGRGTTIELRVRRDLEEAATDENCDLLDAA